MSGLLEKAEKNLNLALDTIANVAEHFAEKTQETAKVAHTRMRMRADQHAMSKLLSKFGVLVYGKAVKQKKLTLDSPEVKELASKIAALEKQIEDAMAVIEKAGEAVQAEAKSAKAKPAAKKAAPRKRKTAATAAAKKTAPKKTAVKKPAAKKPVKKRVTKKTAAPEKAKEEK